MPSDFSTDLLKSIAQQLSCPSGNEGIEMAHTMHESNIGMTLNTIQALTIKEGEKVLELGHGNGSHLFHIMKQAAKIHYTGLEISTTMQQEAHVNNRAYVNNNTAVFRVYDGASIPLADNSFDKIMTVNTIYFWENPSALLDEIYRVLKPGGNTAIAFALKDFMELLPFTQYGFRLYNNEDIQALCATAPFTLNTIIPQKEMVKSKTGEIVYRNYSIAVLEKTTTTQ